LASEKSLSKVVQFLPQVAGQAQNRAIMSIALALAAIVAYIWMRFGNKEFGLAAIVAVVHDVAVTLGMIGVSHLLAGTFIGNALGLTDFRVDLAMIAAILTVIGYGLNDSIVIFDRIRENRGRAGSLTANLINTSINQTLSRTLLTSMTTLMVILTLYIFGGAAVHGFAFALLIGVFVGTYSTLGVAAPLLYCPKTLLVTVFAIAMLGLIGAVLAFVDQAHATARLVLIGVIVVGCGWSLAKASKGLAYSASRPVGA
jgi:SecD/SecF fusion protein